MPNLNVYITRKIPASAISVLTGIVNYDMWEEDFAIPRTNLLDKVRNCDGILSMLTEAIDEPLYQLAPRLRVVSNMAVGYDNVDVEGATRRGILVGNTPGVLTRTCAEFSIALILGAARRINEADSFVRSGNWKGWKPDLMVGKDVYEATLGIFGLGAIGIEVARMARALGMRVIYYSRHRKQDVEAKHGLIWAGSLDSLLKESDFLSIHVALSPETRHSIGANELAKMKRDAILINASRGQVVDQSALYNALSKGQIAGAALDVFENEPISPKDPLLTLPNVLFSPHIASASKTTREKMAAMAVHNLLAGLNGMSMPSCVNPQAMANRPT